MRAQVMMEGGPLDQEIISISTVEGVWPTEIRAASGRWTDSTEKVEADFYRIGEIEQVDTFKAPIYIGTGKYIGNKLSAVTLVTVWTTQEIE